MGLTLRKYIELQCLGHNPALISMHFCCVGFVNSLLSWSAFVPLSRLTYAVYLVHPFVMYLYYASLTSLTYISPVTMVTQFL